MPRIEPGWVIFKESVLDMQLLWYSQVVSWVLKGSFEGQVIPMKIQFLCAEHWQSSEYSGTFPARLYLHKSSARRCFCHKFSGMSWRFISLWAKPCAAKPWPRRIWILKRGLDGRGTCMQLLFYSVFTDSSRWVFIDGKYRNGAHGYRGLTRMP